MALGDGSNGTNGKPTGLVVPRAYKAGYKRARAANAELAEAYVRHVLVTDPPADRAVESIARFPHPEVNRLIRLGMNGDFDALGKEGSEEMRAVFEESATPPAWWNPALAKEGMRAFHKHSQIFLAAFFFATVQNASSLIAKSFYATGRVNSHFGPRRIRQNTRHFIEIMHPGALAPLADGWRLSVRIRLVHAQIRHLIRAEADWDDASYGVPLSAAHMALASSNFSATVLEMVRKLGVRLNREERQSYMYIWRYASLLVGTPEHLLFEGDEQETAAYTRIARICEPPPGEESIVIANALFNALSEIAGANAPDNVDRFARNPYRLARALLGHRLANQLHIPKVRTLGLLALRRVRQRLQNLNRRLPHVAEDALRGASYAYLLEAAVLHDPSYKLPDRLKVEDSAPW